MTRPFFSFATGILITVVSLAATPAFAAPAAPGGGKNTGWQDDFNSTTLDKGRWVVATGGAPGYIAGKHAGYFDPGYVSLEGGFLRLKLTQQTGISWGSAIYTKSKFSYGQYEVTMRMSSTATSPTGPGTSVSGSVSAGFVYVNNSLTEIDMEYAAHLPDTLFITNWHGIDSFTGSTAALFGICDLPVAVNYKFVWTASKISFYVDGVLKAEHTTNIPNAPANFWLSHWGSDNPNFGGLATVGTSRYFYVDSVKYTPLN